MIPASLTYADTKPPGIPNRMVVQRYSPSTPSQVINPGDNVRIDVTTTGFLNPYHTYFNIDVDFSGVGENNVIYQLDGSAYSFFQTMVTYNRGVELERIKDLNLLAQQLIDIKWPIEKRYSHQAEGAGYANYSNITFGKIEGGLSATHKMALLISNMYQATSGALTVEGTTASIPNITNLTSVLGAWDGTQPTGPPTGSQYVVPGLVQYNEYYDPLGQPNSYSTTYTAQTLANFIANTDPVGTGKNGNDIAVTFTGTTPAFKLTPANDGRIKMVEDVVGIDATFGPGQWVGNNLFRQNGTLGLDVLYDTDVVNGATNKQVFNYPLSNGSWEPMFTNGSVGWYNPALPTPSPNNRTNLAYYLSTQLPPSGWLVAPDNVQYSKPIISSGQFKRSQQSYGSFSVPLLSGLFGALMPSKNFKIIPMSAFLNLTFEFQMNPYAFFTSGYCNTNTNSATNQPKRIYQIKRFELVTEQYVFPKDIEDIIMGKYKAGETIYFHSASFVQGPATNIIANSIPGNIQINMGFESLKGILITFVPQDYQNYSWCRQTFRLSHNITKLQLRAGMDYYPSLPALANGGNIAPLLPNSNFQWQRPNSEYYIELLKTFGMYNEGKQETFICPTNFAPNKRIYDPTNYNGMPGGQDSEGNAYQECFNQYGWPLVHENRAVGRAIYTFDCESMSREGNVLSGINTTLTKPFEITLEYQSDNASTFKRLSSAIVFLWYDLVLSVSPSSIGVLGRS